MSALSNINNSKLFKNILKLRYEQRKKDPREVGGPYNVSSEEWKELKDTEKAALLTGNGLLLGYKLIVKE